MTQTRESSPDTMRRKSTRGMAQSSKGSKLNGASRNDNVHRKCHYVLSSEKETWVKGERSKVKHRSSSERGTEERKENQSRFA
jgi:hypothetical protein